jgi:uncharacterized protein YecE (DUF72 family)
MESLLNNRYFSGTSGLLLPVRNKLFYPEEFKDKSRLCFYGSLMNSIEINSSFYKVPMAATVSKWSIDVPEGFRFTFKLSKEITHNKGLAFDPEAVSRFMSVISHAGNKKGSLLIQFPPSVSMGFYKQLQHLLRTVRENDQDLLWHTAVEFRHASLYNERIYELLEELQMGLVLHDKPPAITPILPSSLPFVYLRFHGPGGSYKGSYETELLEEYASYIQEWIAEEKIVYCYFNNTMGEAINNLLTLRDLVIQTDVL